jgi:hypothetical protein
MMFAVLLRRERKMVTGLAGYRITELAKSVREIASRQITGKPLYGNNFLVTNLARQLGNCVRFGKNGLSEGARDGHA